MARRVPLLPPVVELERAPGLRRVRESLDDAGVGTVIDGEREERGPSIVASTRSEAQRCQVSLPALV
jgi:hypothetical protein